MADPVAAETPEPGAPPAATDTTATDATARLIAELTRRGLTIAVAESLTGGALSAELIRIPGASVVVNGGVVAYQTSLKHTLLGVDAALLEEHGPVHPQVAVQMAEGVRSRLAVDGKPADIGVSTTGVAGPDGQGGQEPGTVFLGLARAHDAWVIPLQLQGDRAAIRVASVAAAVEAVWQLLGRDSVE